MGRRWDRHTPLPPVASRSILTPYNPAVPRLIIIPRFIPIWEAWPCGPSGSPAPGCRVWQGRFQVPTRSRPASSCRGHEALTIVSICQITTILSFGQVATRVPVWKRCPFGFSPAILAALAPPPSPEVAQFAHLFFNAHQVCSSAHYTCKLVPRCCIMFNFVFPPH